MSAGVSRFLSRRRRSLLRLANRPMGSIVPAALVEEAIDRSPRGRTRWKQALALYRPFINPGDTVFDIGAHVGRRTAAFLALGAVVVAVEPNPALARYLRWRYRRRPVTVVEAAVGDAPGRLELAASSQATRVSTFSSDWRERRFEGIDWDLAFDVDVVTLDDLVDRFGTPAFCKVDVEGWEAQVMAGLSKPLPALSLEVAGESAANVTHAIRMLAEHVPCEVSYAAGVENVLARPWGQPGEVLRELVERAERDPSWWGDVYVRRLERGH